MSDDEKARQVGEAFLEYQAAKVALVHIEAKVRRVFEMYYRIGESMFGQVPDSRSEPKLVKGKLVFGGGAREWPASDLLDEAGMTELIVERDQARERLAHAAATMRDFGATCLN